MEAVRCLCEEHDLILQVLEHLESLLDKARREDKLRRDAFEPFLEFFHGFTAGAHFCKEEHGLFPLLHERGIPREGSPLSALEREHDAVRVKIRELADELESADQDPAAAARFSVLCTKIIKLLREHIARDNHCALGMATRMLGDVEPDEIAGAYSAAERRAADAATVDNWRALAHELASGPGTNPAGQ